MGQGACSVVGGKCTGSTACEAKSADACTFSQGCSVGADGKCGGSAACEKKSAAECTFTQAGGCTLSADKTKCTGSKDCEAKSAADCTFSQGCKWAAGACGGDAGCDAHKTEGDCK